MLLQPLMTATANNRQNIDDKARFLFFYRSILTQPLHNNVPTPALESLDLSALLNLAERPSLAPEYC